MKGLIAFGANVNCKNAFGQTPLDLAQMHFHREIIGLLESVGGESGLSAKPRGPGAPVWGEAVAKDSISMPPAPQIQPSKKWNVRCLTGRWSNEDWGRVLKLRSGHIREEPGYSGGI